MAFHLLLVCVGRENGERRGVKADEIEASVVKCSHVKHLSNENVPQQQQQRVRALGLWMSLKVVGFEMI